MKTHRSQRLRAWAPEPAGQAQNSGPTSYHMPSDIPITSTVSFCKMGMVRVHTLQSCLTTRSALHKMAGLSTQCVLLTLSGNKTAISLSDLFIMFSLCSIQVPAQTPWGLFSVEEI